jgi:hypothetical protein
MSKITTLGLTGTTAPPYNIKSVLDPIENIESTINYGSSIIYTANSHQVNNDNSFHPNLNSLRTRLNSRLGQIRRYSGDTNG